MSTRPVSARSPEGALRLSARAPEGTLRHQTPATTLDSWISEALAEEEAEGDKTGIRRISWAEEAAEPLIPSSLLPPPRPSGTYELVELSGVLEGDDIEQLRRPGN